MEPFALSQGDGAEPRPADAERRAADSVDSGRRRPTRRGLKPGDIIVEYNGKPVTDSDSPRVRWSSRPSPARPCRSRSCARQAAQVDERHHRRARPRRRAAARHARGRTTDDPTEPTSTGFGMDIDPITPDIARELELPRNQGGAIVSSVEPQQPGRERRRAAERRHPRGQSQGGHECRPGHARAAARPTPARRCSCSIWRVGPSGVGQQIFLTLRKR